MSESTDLLAALQRSINAAKEAGRLTMGRLCEVCDNSGRTCLHGFVLCELHEHECQPCADERDTWAVDECVSCVGHDALMDDRWEQQADDWAIDARREGL